MRYCLKGLEPLANNESQWHVACAKKFFNIPEPPKVELSENLVDALAFKGSLQGVNVTGVQRKLSLGQDTIDQKRLTLVDYPAGYILKVQSPDYNQLPEFESIAMHLAEKGQIRCVEHGLLRSEEGSLAYITKRLDRRYHRGEVEKLYMEDFCQLSGRLTEDKYRGSYEQCAKVVENYSDRSLLDLATLFYLILFSFVIGNSDMHLKNFSLYSPDSKKIVLAPAYDMLPVSLIVEDEDEMALTLLGKRSKLKGSDFIELASRFSLSPKVAPRLIKRLLSLEETFTQYIGRSFLEEEQKGAMVGLIRERLKRLTS